MRAWYKRVYIDLEGEIPEDAPVIFASTHPNSAIDYLYAPFVTNKPCHVLVRGDVFKKPALNWIFRSIWMLPVYRIRDGYSSLKYNDQSFKECYDEFDRNGHVLIFSEGTSVQEKKVQPIRKGTARLALDYALKHGTKEIYIVPVASNYTRFRAFRSSVMVNFRKPIDVRTYAEAYTENPNLAYNKLTQDISESINTGFVTFDNYDDDSAEEKALMALRLNRTTTSTRWLSKNAAFFQEEKLFANSMNSQSGLKNEVADALHEGLNIYQEGWLARQTPRGMLYLKLLLIAPFMLAAGLTVIIPRLISNWIVKKKIKDVLFQNTVTVMGNTLFYLIQWLVVLFVSIAMFGWQGLILPLSMLLITMIGVELVDEFLFAYYNLSSASKTEAISDLYEQVKASA